MRVNSNWKAQEVPRLWTAEDNVLLMLRRYWLAHTYDHRVKMQEKYGVKMTVALCIAKADSSLGRELKTTNNLGNVWNNDRWDRVHFDTIEKWIEAIFKTLTNRYQKRNNKIWELSNSWRAILWLKKCGEAWNYCYATSRDSWNNNVLNCLDSLYKTPKNENFLFRTN